MNSQAFEEVVSVVSKICPGVTISLPQYETVHTRIFFERKLHTIDVRMATTESQRRLEDSVLCLASRLVRCGNCSHESCVAEYTYLRNALEHAFGKECALLFLESLETNQQTHPSWFPEHYHLQVHDPHF